MFAVPTSFNALTDLASLILLSALTDAALLVLLNVGMVNARAPLADAPQEPPALMNSQLSALMVLASPLLLNALTTLNAQSTSHTDAVLANADPEAMIAQLWSLAHLKCQSNAKTKAVSDLNFTALTPLQTLA
jgi:hypothetical protein